MTQKEFFEKVMIEVGGELGEYAQSRIEVINAASQKAKAKANNKTSEFTAKVVEAVENMTENVVITAPSYAEEQNITTQRASSILRKAIELGLMTTTETKGTKGKLKGYVKGQIE